MNGNYAVAVTQNACTDTSACFAVNGVDVVKTVFGNMNVFPNPAADKAIVQFDRAFNGELQLLSPEGKLVFKQKVNSAIRVPLLLGELSPGLYYIQVSSNHGTAVKSLIVQ